MPAAVPAWAAGLATNAAGLLTCMSNVPVSFAGESGVEQGVAVEVEEVLLQLLLLVVTG